ncbi:MAG: hypothetical protein GF409_07455 [Candidatus Omnitrophica bacterium]|nr:hypothetical protein [Candidatus Omnitrophota bacterium]
MENIKLKRTATKAAVIISASFFAIDLVYRMVFKITYFNRENCVIYRNLPKPAFMVFEYFIELFLAVIFGIFLAALVEKSFTRYGRFYPKSPVTAFVYGSLIPVCSCTAIPSVRTMKDKMKFGTVISFIIAAPLLSPYIIMISFSVLGVKYGIIRIVCSFLLAVITGYFLEFFHDHKISGKELSGNVFKEDAWSMDSEDVYLRTYAIFKSLLPYLLAAALLGIMVELFLPANFLMKHKVSTGASGVLTAILAGVPIYLCNGADVLFLRALADSGGVPLGTAMAFSLSSTAICLTSLILLVRFLGKRMTALLVSVISILLF